MELLQMFPNREDWAHGREVLAMQHRMATETPYPLMTLSGAVGQSLMCLRPRRGAPGDRLVLDGVDEI